MHILDIDMYDLTFHLLTAPPLFRSAKTASDFDEHSPDRLEKALELALNQWFP